MCTVWRAGTFPQSLGPSVGKKRHLVENIQHNNNSRSWSSKWILLTLLSDSRVGGWLLAPHQSQAPTSMWRSLSQGIYSWWAQVSLGEKHLDRQVERWTLAHAYLPAHCETYCYYINICTYSIPVIFKLNSSKYIKHILITMRNLYLTRFKYILIFLLRFCEAITVTQLPWVTYQCIPTLQAEKATNKVSQLLPTSSLTGVELWKGIWHDLSHDLISLWSNMSSGLRLQVMFLLATKLIMGKQLTQLIVLYVHTRPTQVILNV